MPLLTKHNFKLDKSKDFGYLSHGLHLAPANLSGKNVCTSSTAGCRKVCLNQSGQGYSNRVQLARIEKTKKFNENREEFMRTLIREISAKLKNKPEGFNICFRPNLTSDVPWEKIKIDGKNIMEHFPQVQFYDYAKNMKRMLNFITGDFPKNYHLTFSRSEKNESDCKIVLGCGAQVAVVFRKELPKTYMGKKVINGDEHDLRFLNPKNCVIGLLPKGRARKDTTGFVVDL